MIQNRPPVEDRFQQSAPSPRESKASARLCQYIEENPTTAVLLGLGVGLGTGVMLGCLLRESADYFRHEDSLADRIGNRVRESVQGVIPSSWKHRLDT